MKLEINNKRETGNFTNVWKLTNILSKIMDEGYIKGN